MSPVSQRKLLLADDSVTIQKVVNLTFADEGIEVITVGDGDSAMAKFAELAPDLVMADVNMPGLSGYEVCEKIRQSSAPNIPVILLVGSFEPFDETEANRVGANDFLTKPFQSIRQLVNKVTELLDTTARGNGDQETTGDFSEAKTLDGINVPPEYLTNQAAASAQTQSVSAYNEADDEMIESSSGAGGYVFDESAKFQTREVDETPSSADAEQSFETEDAVEAEQTGESENQVAENQTTEADDQSSTGATDDYHAEAKTGDLFDEDDLLEIYFDEDEEDEADEETDEQKTSAPIASEAVSSETVAEHNAQANQQFAQSEPAESSTDSDAENFPHSSAETTAQASETESPQPSATAAQSGQLSAEMIDAIAQRVIEKLSDRAVKEVAWEVVPQHAELIIKKMVEEKMKE